MILLLILAHSWYPHECCEDTHCHPVPCAEISDTGGPYLHWWGYDFVKSAARLSPDSQCHVCVGGGNSYCIFLPRASS